MSRYTLLIVDDEKSQRETLSGFLTKKGYEVFTVDRPTTALEIVRERMVDLVISDYRMPEMNGIELLKELRSLRPDLSFILVTAFGTIENAVDALRMGAAHYLTKPVDLEELLLTIESLLEKQLLLRENKQLKEQLARRSQSSDLITGSGEMDEVLNLVYRAAPSQASILLLGESGTGKEMIARLIHEASPFRDGEFVAVNMAAIPETLIESELFGHEKGSFTGADRQKIGLMEKAQYGTLFIDEVGDIPLAMQVKLLRALQEGEIIRVGGSDVITLNLRVVAATHRDLEQMVRDGEFREDLYYRLNVISVPIKPLRQRRSDIPPLVEHFISRYGTQYDRPDTTISREAMDLLLKYGYPGNVRELENAIERAVVLCRDQEIRQADLPLSIQSTSRSEADVLPEGTLPEILESLEKRLVHAALERSGGNKSRAARDLGISEKNIRDRLKRWGDAAK